MREENYLFRIGREIFRLNIRFSKIGNIYPSIFFAFRDNSYLKYDLRLGIFLSATEENFWEMSGSLALLTDKTKVVETFSKYGLSFSAFEDALKIIISNYA